MDLPRIFTIRESRHRIHNPIDEPKLDLLGREHRATQDVGEQFVDLSAHGYAKVRLTQEDISTEFVCIPRPITRAATPDGGPLRYRISQAAKLWKPGEAPKLEMRILEGDPGLGW